VFACFLTILPFHASLPLTVKDFKAVSGQNKYVGSLDEVTTVEKEKFLKNFWPDVSVCVWAGRGQGGPGCVGTNGSIGAEGGVCPI
jgi:hypothetical protein